VIPVSTAELEEGHLPCEDGFVLPEVEGSLAGELGFWVSWLQLRQRGLSAHSLICANDRRVHYLYDLVVDELLERLKLIRG